MSYTLENRFFIYNNPILIFYGIFFAYMPYSAFGQQSVSVCGKKPKSDHYKRTNYVL